jgi:hypothetical protein
MISQKLTACLLASLLSTSTAFTSPSTRIYVPQIIHHGLTGNNHHHMSHRRGTELNMMFDQLSAALTEAAQNFGGKQR